MAQGRLRIDLLKGDCSQSRRKRSVCKVPGMNNVKKELNREEGSRLKKGMGPSKRPSLLASSEEPSRGKNWAGG